MTRHASGDASGRGSTQHRGLLMENDIFQSVADQRRREPCLECGLSPADREVQAQVIATLRTENARLNQAISDATAVFPLVNGGTLADSFRLLKQLVEERERAIAQLTHELDEARGNYEGACATIATMHAAAVGEVTMREETHRADLAEAKLSKMAARLDRLQQSYDLNVQDFATETRRTSTLLIEIDKLKTDIEGEPNGWRHHARRLNERADQAEAQLQLAMTALDGARAVLSIAMDALESDADLDTRRRAFELAQNQFEGLSNEENERYAARRLTVLGTPERNDDEEPAR